MTGDVSEIGFERARRIFLRIAKLSLPIHKQTLARLEILMHEQTNMVGGRGHIERRREWRCRIRG